ncbi:circularly permuted type 2 ATP-grasp protein [Roseiconus nitratireducens]|uniref:Circularly permuted type 2 ATP-grasp protein n=1 Tax=Roseiconus nitratireducens TaxID=2605748 RepID=A0A5M6DDC8_9BACT|nr:circularly permuted type 2 ATP-grasp protein [Roseiconus nitratireducens]KAA5544410.1 circularly permuted type 2 ATP-grasp protein [Roseiconus nitratireducens]
MQEQSQSQSQSVRLRAKTPLPSLPNYQTDGFYDELVDENNIARPDAESLISLFNNLPPGELSRRQHAIERALYRMGITFTVYSDQAGTEKIMPFDVVPRIVSAMLWKHIDAGLKQRIRALNRFLCDIYNERQIVHDGIIPAELIDTAPSYLKQCKGLKPFNDVWCHITGTDLVRDNSGTVYVLEDNLRCPSGVSYVLQNRHVMKRNFPQAFSASRVRPVSNYSSQLFQLLCDVAPPHVANPTVVVLTPGVYNSAYYEHSYLAQRMGAVLVEGRDLVVEGDLVYMRTTSGLQRVDVIYRRVDDTFLDPKTFRKDSCLGVEGLMDVYRAGNITLANAPGTGIADDKVIYAFVPDMIHYYLDEEPILPNVPTYVCQKEDDRKYVLEHLDELVVKAAGESGGYGILIGPHATLEERAEFAEKIRKDPRNWIAQPTLELSRAPTVVGDHLEGRHVDLRPYILCSRPDDVWVLPGGLTRVALRKGSLVVNSSQGGGSKDTWVAAEAGQAVASLHNNSPE